MDDPLSAVTFGTDGWRARGEAFTHERVRAIAQAVADHLRAAGHAGDAVGVCYDARESSEPAAEEAARVLAANGHDVEFADRDRPTPLLAWRIVDRDLAGGLMVTASHNPPEYNGVKFVPAGGAPALPPVTDDVADRLRAPDPAPETEHGRVERVDYRAGYDEHVLGFAEDLSGLTVAYDAMHGSGRGTTDDLLERAGADVERLHCDRDPDFGGRSPEPGADQLPELRERVRTGAADLGIANDGDADRLAVVTPEGVLDENLFFAALYDWLLEDRAGPAVRTVSTTYLIDRVAAAAGESVVETAVGFKWVAEAMAEHDALVGGEESGGFTVRGHVREKDGVLLALLAASMHAADPVDERVERLLAEHGRIVQDKVSVDCPDEHKDGAMAALAGDIPETVAGRTVEEVVETDGFKLLLADGAWLLVRPSGTEPKLRVYAEADDEDAVADLLAEGRALVEAVL